MKTPTKASKPLIDPTATATAEQLADLSGLSTARIYQHVTGGKIPKPDRGRWRALETVKALFAAYRQRREPEALTAAKLKKIETETTLLEIELGKKQGVLVETSRVTSAMQSNVARAVAMLRSAFVSELPAKQGGIDADQITKMNEERLNEIFAELSKPLV